MVIAVYVSNYSHVPPLAVNWVLIKPIVRAFCVDSNHTKYRPTA